jgi:hypothetical protein
MEYEKVHLFMTITTDTTFTDSGYENETYTGKMMLLVSSNIDETYADKYADYIQPLMAGALATMNKHSFVQIMIF